MVGSLQWPVRRGTKYGALGRYHWRDGDVSSVFLWYEQRRLELIGSSSWDVGQSDVDSWFAVACLTGWRERTLVPAKQSCYIP